MQYILSVSVSSVFLLFPWNNLTLQLYQNKETISYNCLQLLKSIKLLTLCEFCVCDYMQCFVPVTI